MPDVEADPPSADPARPGLVGSVLSGRYRVLAALGEGGMGAVYLAEHMLMRKRLAVKVLHPEMSHLPEVVARFEREALVASHLDHPNVAAATDFGKLDDGSFFLVLEYVEGQSLREVLEGGPLSLGRALHVIRQMGSALSRAHGIGIVHRDLKPDNVMLVSREGDPDFVKLLVFGIAKVPTAEVAGSGAPSSSGPALTQIGMVYGTPEYMAPEQARGDDATPLCDLYALGILFYEMLTGQLPFRSNDRDTLLEMQRSSPPPRPSVLRKDIAPQAEAIILRLLEKDASKRFRDGHHLQEELKAFQRSLPSKLLENSQAEAPAAMPPPPPAPSAGVQEWGTRAANFQRTLARAFPNGRVLPDLQTAMDSLWEMAARASRLEGELSSQSRKLDATERRGRALRAELGRKVEELATDESRTLREATEWRERAQGVDKELRASAIEYEAANRRSQEAESKGGDIRELRQIFEGSGAARAKVEASQRQIDTQIGHATRHEARAAELRRQIDELRGQLQHYSDGLENDLISGRDRIAAKVKEALTYEQRFGDASNTLILHLRDRPECRDMIDELVASDKQAPGTGSGERRSMPKVSEPTTDPAPDHATSREQ